MKNPIPLDEKRGSRIQAYSPRFEILLVKDLYYKISIGEAVWEVKGYVAFRPKVRRHTFPLETEFGLEIWG
jgi:hypothetical protein